MAITNQHAAGTCFERAVEMIGNGKNVINPYPKDVTAEEFERIADDAQNAYDWLESYYGYIDSIAWTGAYTGSTSSDLVINGEKVELKYVKTKNAGTWLNTSMNCFKEGYGFPHMFNYYLAKHGCYDYLESAIGKRNVSRKLASPVSQELSAKIIKNNPEIFAEYKKLELVARADYVREVVEYFENNPTQLEYFCNDIITKSICARKKMPNLLLIYCHATDEIVCYDQDEIADLTEGGKIKFNDGDCQFYIGKMRCAFAWKNGLIHPTLKVFI